MRSREGSVYQRADGRWVATVDFGRVNGRRDRPVRYAPTEREAKAKLRALIREKDAGRLGDDCTVGQWLTLWLDTIAPERAGARTVANYRSHVTHWIAPILGARRLSQLRPEDVRRLRTHVETTGRLDASGNPTGTPHSPTTVRAVLVTLSAALTAAERERRITWNPARAVVKPRVSGEHHEWLTTEQARQVIAAAATPEEQARAGVPAVPLHGARAACASMLREAGVPVSTIGAILGHRPGSPITGLSYAHSQDAELRNAIGMLD